jgi:hypothetical protein
MANGMMNDPNAPMGGEAPMAAPGEQPQQMGAVDDAVLDMHLTEDVKKALSAKGVDISAVAERGPQEPVVVIPVSVIMNRYQGETPEASMQQFVEDMTAASAPPTGAAPTGNPMGAAEAAPPTPVEPTGLGAAPTMDRPPMTA